MHISSVLLIALFSARINAVPLNINLGAYSPALVVGDGEISFKGKDEVSDLMDVLEGAAVSGAAKNGASTLDGTTGAADTTASEGLGVPEKAPISGFPPQGLGKIIAPRSTQLTKRAEEKRDINGFNAALNYASEALGKGPLIELSTGQKGSGVGVTVQPSKSTPNKAQLAPPPLKNPAPAGAKNGLGRRDDSQNPKTKTTVTTMFVRGGPRPDSAVEGSEVKDVEKRSTPTKDVGDNFNLKVADGELAELTFVETRSLDEDTEDKE